MFGRFKRGNVVTDAQRAVEVFSDPNSQPADAQAALSQMLKSAAQADPAQRDAAMKALAEAVPTLKIGRAAFLALGAGALIEGGANPKQVAEPILTRTAEALTRTLPFVAACRAAAEAAGPSSTSDEEDEEPEDDDSAAVERFGDQVGSTMPEGAEAFGALESLEAATLAILCRSKETRQRAHADKRFKDAVRQLESACHLESLAKMLSVLDDEELIVLHPEQQRGYVIRIAGIGDNFQLHTLLAGTLIGDPAQGWLSGDRPDPRAVALAHNAPYDADQHLTEHGAFNLVNWFGLRPDGTLPEGTADHDSWIWNEGIPDDIAPFEGTRVILLGPPPYARSWNAGRFFPGMAGELQVVRQLSGEETRQWLARLAAAPQPARPTHGDE
jgi:hypothetical protein